MNMQQMLIQAQKIQRDLKKALDELGKKEFVISKGGLVTVTVLGNKTVKSVDIDKDAFDPDNKEMVEESICLAISEAIAKIEKETAEINERITGRPGGMLG